MKREDLEKLSNSYLSGVLKEDLGLGAAAVDASNSNIGVKMSNELDKRDALLVKIKKIADKIEECAHKLNAHKGVTDSGTEEFGKLLSYIKELKNA